MRMWQLTRKGAPPDSWTVIVREPVTDESGRRRLDSITHTIGLVWKEDHHYWTAAPKRSVKAGGFPTRADAAQCCFDDWNTTAASHEVTARIRAFETAT